MLAAIVDGRRITRKQLVNNRLLSLTRAHRANTLRRPHGPETRRDQKL
jgi:hypothetical protein